MEDNGAPLQKDYRELSLLNYRDDEIKFGNLMTLRYNDDQPLTLDI
jgi:hypothetical protein